MNMVVVIVMNMAVVIVMNMAVVAIKWQVAVVMMILRKGESRA